MTMEEFAVKMAETVTRRKYWKIEAADESNYCGVYFGFVKDIEELHKCGANPSEISSVLRMGPPGKTSGYEYPSPGMVSYILRRNGLIEARA